MAKPEGAGRTVSNTLCARLRRLFERVRAFRSITVVTFNGRRLEGEEADRVSRIISEGMDEATGAVDRTIARLREEMRRSKKSGGAP